MSKNTFDLLASCKDLLAIINEMNSGTVEDQNAKEYLIACAKTSIENAENEKSKQAALFPEMAQALKDARDTIQHWGNYAGEYFQKKHDLAGDLAAIDNLIARIENN